jgi:hypothetical protein
MAAEAVHLCTPQQLALHRELTTQVHGLVDLAAARLAAGASVPCARPCMPGSLAAPMPKPRAPTACPREYVNRAKRWIGMHLTLS